MKKTENLTTSEIEQLMDHLTDLEFRDIGYEIMEEAKKWKMNKINDDLFFYQIRKKISDGINRRNLIRQVKWS